MTPASGRAGERAERGGPIGRPGGAWRPVAAGLLALAIAGFGCSGLNPEEPPVPVDPNSPCARTLEIFTPLTNGLRAVGTDTTLDVATWNMEFFPLTLPGDFNCGHAVAPSRIVAMAELIRTLDLDIIACQEVSDTTGFRQLVAARPEYGGVIAPETFGCNYQRAAILYHKERVTLRSVKSIFTGRSNSSAFPRPPLEAFLTISQNGRSYDLHLVSLHLKAGGGEEDAVRRRDASAKLKVYLDQVAATDPEANYLLAGDWNDTLEEALGVNSFTPLLQAPNDFKFLNAPLAGRREFASHPTAGGVMIDHLMVNEAACPDFAGGRVTTLRLDLIVPGYSQVSDHRPVMVQAPIFK